MITASITLEQAKTHLMVTHNMHDAYIAELIPTAMTMIENDIDRPLTDPKCLTITGQLATPLVSAAKLVIGDLYRDRESTQPHQLYKAPAYERLVSYYRRMGL